MDVMDKPPEDPIDWRTVDRLIILMSLTLTKRMLRRLARRRVKAMPEEVRLRVLDRIGKLIEAYKRPRV